MLSLRRSTRRVERGVWRWYLALGPQGTGWRHRIAKGWLRYRLRIGMRLREARYSVPAALARSLASGLPVAAVIAASVPVWGMSWFFDTENWASGMWNSWAESRTDSWRAAMVREVTKEPRADAATFSVNPPGATSGDFSFIVIGDTGEGDASQHVLRDQLLSVAGRDDVRFVVVSSDVVYPNGSMIDYEAKFWLPFKGVKKPVYAIPGNHDWYDALEAFLATFVEAGPARAAMHARAEADLRVTSSTSARIDGLIAEADRLRRDYEVPTGFQRGPFFDIQTDRFALVAIDTGIVKRIDREQRAWLEASLDRARGKTTMAVVGHPFYAGGYDMTDGHDEFAELKRLLVSRGVTIMMAGDTHDLEYYADPPAWPRSRRPLLRQRRRRRLYELRHRAGMARPASDGRVGVLSRSRCRRRQDQLANTVVETSRVVVDDAVRRLAVLGGMAVGRLRLQRGAVFPELRRSARRTIVEPDPAVALRRQWQTPLARSLALAAVVVLRRR